MRLKHIDALRGIAAVLVTLFHLTGNSGLSKSTANYGRYGYLGVEIFFVISGFILPYSLLKTGYHVKMLGIFIRKRIVRIYPAYLFSVLIGVILAVIVGRPLIPATAIFMHLFLLNHLFNYPSISPVFWTLGIELQFYLLIGLLFPFFSAPHTKSVLWIGAFTIVAACLNRYSNLIFSWFPLFALGMLLFNKMFTKLPAWVFWLAATVLLILIVFTHGLPEAIASLFAVCFILFVKTEKPNRFNKIILWFGTVSYSLYLVHWELGRAAINALRRIPVIGNQEPIKIFIGFTFSVFCAWLLYLCIEKPSIKYSIAIKYKRDS